MATDWGNLEGTLSNGRIDWANGSVWEWAPLHTVAGWYAFSSPQNPRAEIGQRGGELTFLNEHGDTSDGGFLDAETVVATDWGNLIGHLDQVPGKIVWDNASDWIRSLDGAWQFNGQQTSVQQTAVSLMFFNETGNPSNGQFVDIDHVEATDWGSLGAVLSSGEIAWVNNSTWTRSEPTPGVAPAGDLAKEVDYTYDVFDRLIRKQVDDTGDGSIDRAEAFVYDGDDVVLSFDGTGSLTHRYLYGPAVDQVFADEDALGEILWGLPDNQGTVRDVVDYDAVSDTTTIANHRVFTAFGELTSNATTEFRYFYTGRYLDPDTGLQNNGARWYDATTGRWMSEDPIGLGPDSNAYRYVHNNPANRTDSTGLAEDDVIQKNGSAYWVSSTFFVKYKYPIGTVDANNRFTDSLGLKVNVDFETLRRVVRGFSTAKVCERFKTDAGQWSFIKGTIRSVQLREAEAARRIPVEGGFRLRPLTAEEKLGTNVDRYEMKVMRNLQWQARRDAGANAIHDTWVGIKREAINQGVGYAAGPVIATTFKSGKILLRIGRRRQMIINAASGAAREVYVYGKLKGFFKNATVQKQCYLRYANGKRAIDTVTKTGRRIDFAIIEGGQARFLVETTSKTAKKGAQLAKEARIRAAGGHFIRDRATGELVDVSQILTRTSRRK